MTTQEILVKAKELIELGWTKDAPARKENGRFTYATDVEACAWCATGSLMAAENTISPNQDCLRLLKDICDTDLVSFNDDPNTTHSNVIAAFDEAIKRCQNDN